jgi:hypothetical protein
MDRYGRIYADPSLCRGNGFLPARERDGSHHERAACHRARADAVIDEGEDSAHADSQLRVAISMLHDSVIAINAKTPEVLDLPGP